MPGDFEMEIESKEEAPATPASPATPPSPSQEGSDAVASMPLPPRSKVWGSPQWSTFGMPGDDDHVTVWQPATGKTIAGNAAPYRRNLPTWLSNHPGWEEKADRLKSSKRRSAARRTKSANAQFDSLCGYTPIISAMLTDIVGSVNEGPQGEESDAEGEKEVLSNEIALRVQEGLIEMARSIYYMKGDITKLGSDRWSRFAFAVDSSLDANTILSFAHKLMQHRRDQVLKLDASKLGSPVSLSVGSQNSTELEGSGDIPPGAIPAFMQQPFRAQREPRVTVWNPSTGRTISGNAAPCRRNLEKWMKKHPGWVPKAEEDLSSSRRKKPVSKARSAPRSNRVLSARMEAQAITEAVSGLFLLKAKAVEHTISAPVADSNAMDVDTYMCDSPPEDEPEQIDVEDGDGFEEIEDFGDCDNGYELCAY